MYEVNGWEIFEGVVDWETQVRLRAECIRLRENWQKYSDWKGISCASRYSYDLRQFYKSYLVPLAQSVLGTENIYYFNDQAVVKKPFDNMIFAPHYDNFFGPNADGKIHTVNLLVCLDDVTAKNGGLWLQNRESAEWVSVHPKAGDVVAINGNTYHRSEENRSLEERAMYACVYTEKPLELEGFYDSPVIIR